MTRSSQRVGRIVVVSGTTKKHSCGKNMITESELIALLSEIESFRVERTRSVDDTDKFSKAICAFSNDIAGSGKPGYLLIGADDKTGNPIGLQVTDRLLQNLGSLATNGNILPAPALIVTRMKLTSDMGEIAVVEVQPSNLPPVRYKGQAWIRRGPSQGIANSTEESILIERRTSSARTFDAQPCISASLADLSLELFTTVYRPQAVDAVTIDENHRPIENQLASLRFFDLRRNAPTYAGLILFASDLLAWLPNAFIQYVQFNGTDLGSDPINEKIFRGDLLTLIRDLNSFVSLITIVHPIRQTALRETDVSDYPEAALREFLMNAVLHRSYESNSQVRFYHFTNRLEILSPGNLYGETTRENFPRQTSYRNPILAEAMKTLGAVNRYGRGVERAQALLKGNGNPPAEFEFGDTFFGVTIRPRS